MRPSLVAQVFATEWPRIVATLVRQFHDIDLAERRGAAGVHRGGGSVGANINPGLARRLADDNGQAPGY